MIIAFLGLHSESGSRLGKLDRSHGLGNINFFAHKT